MTLFIVLLKSDLCTVTKEQTVLWVIVVETTLTISVYSVPGNILSTLHELTFKSSLQSHEVNK
jgi:hypothetical protein